MSKLKDSTIIGEKNGRLLLVRHIKLNPPNLIYVENKTEELCFIATKYASAEQLKSVLSCIPDHYQTNDFWLKAAIENDHVMAFVPQQSTEFCLSVIEQKNYIDDRFYHLLTNQHEDILKALLRKNGRLIKHIPHKTRELCLIALQNNASLSDIPHPDQEMYLAAVTNNGHALRYIPEAQRSPELCLTAVQEHSEALKYVPEQTATLCLAAMQNRKRIYFDCPLPLVQQQSPEICLAAVQQHSGALKYVLEQTPEICLAAVQYWGYSLEYVKDKTFEICLAAVQQSGQALKYVFNQTPELCLAAIQQDPEAIRHVYYQTPELCLAAVQQNGIALQYIKEQTYDICYSAIQNNPKAYDLIKDEQLKAQLPKKIAKTKRSTTKSRKINHSDVLQGQFDPSQLQHSRIAQADAYIQQQLDPARTLHAIHHSWHQNRYQEDEHWLEWISAINDQKQQPTVRFYVAYHQAFCKNNAAFQLDEFNLYHYIRIQHLFNTLPLDHQIFKKYSRDDYTCFFNAQAAAKSPTQPLIEQLYVADIDIFFFIDYLNQYYPHINDAYVFNYLFTQPLASVSTQIFIHNKNFTQLIINHFKQVQQKVSLEISDDDFRQKLRRFSRDIPNIDLYIQELMLTHTDKPIRIDLIAWLSDYPSIANQQFLQHLLKQEKDLGFIYLLSSALAKMGFDGTNYLSIEYLTEQATKILARNKKKSMPVLDLNQLPSLTWKQNNEVVESNIVQSWFILALNAPPNFDHHLLDHYLDLLTPESQILLAEYIFSQFEHYIKQENASTLRYNALLIFTQHIDASKILHLIEYMQRLIWPKPRLLINQQRTFMAAKMSQGQFDRMENYEFSELKKQYFAEIERLKQHITVNEEHA